jgi:hypothetical protein
MSGTETCDICFARDRETLIRPAVQRRIEQLVQEAVADIRKMEGAGFSGDDSGLKDVFEEWADQIATQHSIIFDTYDDLVWSVCAELVSKLGEVEIALLAAYSDKFDDYSCTKEFIETQSLDGFDAESAVTNQLYRALEDFSVNYAEQRGGDGEGTEE